MSVRIIFIVVEFVATRHKAANAGFYGGKNGRKFAVSIFCNSRGLIGGSSISANTSLTAPSST